MDEALRQLMLQMQLRSLVGNPSVFDRIAADPPRDNRDMQVQAPGQNQFPNQMFGQLLHPNAAGIYGSGERLPPEGDVVLPSAGYRSASGRNAYMPSVNEYPYVRNFEESTLLPRSGGGTRISDTGDPVSQLMWQMQMQSMMGGNQQRDPFDAQVETYGGLLPHTVRESDMYMANPRAPYEYIEPPAAGELPPHMRQPDEVQHLYRETPRWALPQQRDPVYREGAPPPISPIPNNTATNPTWYWSPYGRDVGGAQIPEPNRSPVIEEGPSPLRYLPGFGFIGWPPRR